MAKKILCIIDALGSGGAERQIVGLAGLLKEAGYDVVQGCYYSEPMFEGYTRHLQEKEVPLEIELPKGSGFLSKVFAIRRLIKRTGADVVISYNEMVNLKVLLACLLMKKKKVIVSQRNTYSGKSLTEKVCANLYRFADYVVPNSYSQTEVLNTHFSFLKDKVVTITNFVDTEKYISVQKASEGDTLKLLTVARINIEQKNADNYLKAIKKLKDSGLNFHADWYGKPTSQDILQQLEQQIEELGIGDVFSFHAPHSNILEVYQQADLFCLPSKYEGFPNVVCEAMSCSLPIVCGNVCDNSSLVKEGENGYLFNPLNPDEIADTITRYCALTEEGKEQMRKASRRIVVDKCSPKTFVDAYIKLIEE